MYTLFRFLIFQFIFIRRYFLYYKIQSYTVHFMYNTFNFVSRYFNQMCFPSSFVECKNREICDVSGEILAELSYLKTGRTDRIVTAESLLQHEFFERGREREERREGGGESRANTMQFHCTEFSIS